MSDEVADAFSLYDKNNDGKIPVAELGTLIRACGRNPTNSEVDDLIAEYLQDKKEFELSTLKQCLGKPKTKADSPEQVKEAFKIFDKESNGLVSLSELRHVLTTLGEKMTTQEVDELLKDAKVDKEGNINYNVFVSMIMPNKF
jgi:calmodulin